MTDTTGFTDELRDEDKEESTEARRAITLGWDMEDFLNGKVGTFLQRRAAVEIAQFQLELETVNPDDRDAIALLQREIAVRRIWKDWIVGAVQEGIARKEIALETNVI